jgi:hypothetical protein
LREILKESFCFSIFSTENFSASIMNSFHYEEVAISSNFSSCN